MNLILLAPDQIEGGRVRLGGSRARHIRRVLGKGEGDSVRIGVEGVGVGRARIVRIGGDGVVLDLGSPADLEPPPRAVPHALALALPRPPMLRRALHTAACMGVKEIHVFHAARVERSFWGSKALEPEGVRVQLVLGLEQARDCILPSVTFHRAFRPFAEDALPAIAAGDPILVADLSGAPCPTDQTRRHVLLVGPEGGLVPFELERLREQGADAVTLGPRALRVDTAIPALLARLGPVGA